MTGSERWRSPGGPRELLALAIPFILSNSFWTLQITIDRVFLGWWKPEAVGASMPAMMVFWTPLALFQQTAAFATTFVAQYIGSGRSERAGPAVWQAIHFSLIFGIAFLVIVPFAGPIIAWGGHSAEMQELEKTYLICLAFSALPTMIIAAVGSFFSGKGDSWTVLYMNVLGLVVDSSLNYVWIFGYLGFPEMGIAGAGWSTVVGSWVSALLGLGLMLRKQYRAIFHTLSGWKFELELFLRLMRFGIPSGFQWFLDGLAFTVFTFLVGQLGDAELTASSVAFTLNMIAFLPAMGIGQAVTVFVGQRLGEDRPDIAERSVWTGFYIVWIYMATVACLYFFVPELFMNIFLTRDEAGNWASVALILPVLLRFVAVYSLFDSSNLVFSFALKGAGDTRFVMFAALGLSWMSMVIPTIITLQNGGGLYWAWTWLSAYVIILAFVLLWRFRQGKWKSMRVIETPLGIDTIPVADAAKAAAILPQPEEVPTP